MKYSFIVPVYNCEKYIGECLESILAQSIKDFEIVVIDDGSTDLSGSICDSYAQKHSCIRVIHKENGGVSVARNLGIEEAKGDYVGFVDSDDMISPCLLEYAESFDEDYDIIVFRHTRRSADALCKVFEKTELECGDKIKVLDRTIYDDKNSDDYLYNTVSKLFKRALLSDVRFVKGITIGEDKLFGFNAFMKSEHIFFCDRVMYYCRAHSGSVMHRCSDGYNEVAEKTFVEYENSISSCDEKEHFEKMLSLRAVKIMHNIAVLELCNKASTLPYKLRKEKWQGILANSITGKYFAQCDGVGLNEKDKFFLYAYKQSFFRVELMTKYKLFKASEYALYKLLKR